MIRKTLAPLLLAFVACIVVQAAVAAASSTLLRASLSSKQEVAKAKLPANASGSFRATLVGSTLDWSLSVTRVGGVVTTAHIDLGMKDNLGPLLAVLCGPCKTHASGHTHLSAKTVSALKDGQAYVNVYTSKHPNGVVRGQIG